MTQAQLQPFHNRIYELIGDKMVDEDEELNDEIAALYDSAEDYNQGILDKAIETVLSELRDELLRTWTNQ